MGSQGTKGKSGGESRDKTRREGKNWRKRESVRRRREWLYRDREYRRVEVERGHGMMWAERIAARCG